MNTSPMAINKPMAIGVTGTREFMSQDQQIAIMNLVVGLGPEGVEVHHGDCVGADLAFHQMAVKMRDWHIVIHPPIFARHRAYCRDILGRAEITELDPLTYLARNEEIVDNVEVLFAYPKENEWNPQKVMRSGTWATVRYALESGLCAVLALPNGELHELRPNGQGGTVHNHIGHVIAKQSPIWAEEYEPPSVPEVPDTHEEIIEDDPYYEDDDWDDGEDDY